MQSTTTAPQADTSNNTDNQNTQDTQNNQATSNIITNQPTDKNGKWYDSLPDDSKGFAENKGFDTPEILLNKYRDLEKVSQIKDPEKYIKLPETPEERNEIYNKLGRPAKPEDYKLESIDPNVIPSVNKWAYDAGLSPEQAQHMVKEHVNYVNGQIEAQEAFYAERDEKDEQRLKKELGAEYPKFVETISRVARHLGWDDEKRINFSRTMGLYDAAMDLNKIATNLLEQEYVGHEESNSFNMTPQQAEAQLNELESDPDFAKKVLNGDLTARRKRKTLMEIISYGKQ